MKPILTASQYKPDSPPDLFKLHTLAAFIGPRGSGKTNAAILLAKENLDFGSFNRVFIISPTFENNSAFHILDPQDDDVYTSMSGCQEALREIIDKIEEMVEEYKLSILYKNAYERFQNDNATEEDIVLLEKMLFEEPKVLPVPSPLLIIDDMSHSDLYSTSRRNPFVNLCLRHRHLHRVGVTIYMLVQNYRNGVPKCIRQNIQQFYLWFTHDKTQLQAMYEEFANLLSYKQFTEMFERATENRHDFLTIDLDPIEPQIQFRKNFNEVIDV